MIKFILIIIGFYFSPVLMAGDCTELFLYRAIPKMPLDTKVQHSLIKYGSCEIETEFELSGDGLISDVRVRASKERCRAFEASALEALKESQFKKSMQPVNCNLKFKMDVDLEI